MKQLFFLGTYLLLICPCYPQGTCTIDKNELLSPWQMLRKNSSEGLYLKTFKYLVENESCYLDSSTTAMERSSYFDVLIQLYNYFGEFDKSKQTENRFLTEINSINKTRFSGTAIVNTKALDSFQILPAREAIGKISQVHQVIMINEEHRNTAHRELVRQILPVLYENGFRYLALETLAPVDSALNERGYPVFSTGYYSADPVFGDLIRQAIKIGFKVIGYDFAGSAGLLNSIRDPNPFVRDNTRDSFAARIINNILSTDPAAKILVHAGRAHVAKIKSQGLAMLAYHFREFSGIEPFTIDQVQMNEFDNPLDEKPVYKYAMEKYPANTPYVFMRNNHYWRAAEGYDVSVFSPRTNTNGHKRDWMLSSGERKKVPVDYNKLGIKLKKHIFYGAQPLLIQVFYRTEGEKAIPAQQQLLWPGKPANAKFALFSGNYVVRIKDENNKVLSSYEQHIP